MGERTGPGETRYTTDEAGNILQRRWNDDGWVTRFLEKEEQTPKQIADALRRAYLEGFEDRATLIRGVLGASQ